MINRERANDILELLLLLASILLIVGLSIEVIAGNKPHFSHWFLTLQLFVCLLFLLSFFVGVAQAAKPHQYIARNILFLFLSIPYLNIFTWLSFDLDRSSFMLAGVIPVVRSLLALTIILRWTINGKAARGIFFAYMLAVSLFTYLAALIFYDVEYGVNSELTSFGDAFWWAWMGLSTAGAEIAPITAIGRTLAVILPLLGMMILPIFTGYILSIENPRKKSES